MATKTEAKRHGLRLTLPGAPATPHTVAGLNGYYWPNKATPVGGAGELSMEIARKLHADKGVDLELVEITEAEATAYARDLDEFRKANGRYLAEAARLGGAEGQIARDEMKAAGASTTTDDAKDD